MRSLAASLTIILALNASAFGARINVVSPNIIDPQRDGCNLSLQGEIVAGDFDRMRAARQELQSLIDKKYSWNNPNMSLALLWQTKSPVLCLNSNGGDYIEGLKIARFLLNRNEETINAEVTTYIPPGAICYSSCAIIFMAGKGIDRGGEHFPARLLHITARLGFHAQYVKGAKLDNRSYTSQDLANMYRKSIDETREFVHLFDYRSEGGSGIGDQGSPWVAPSLFSEILARGPSEIYLIDTIGKAGRWNIGLGGVRRLRNTADGLQMMCANGAAWSNDQTVWEGERFYPAPVSEILNPSLIPPRSLIFKSLTLRVPTVCAASAQMEGSQLTGGIIAIGRGALDRTYYVGAWAAVDPRTPLVSLVGP